MAIQDDNPIDPSHASVQTSAGKVISRILRHDAKVTSYKIALIRALADVALSFPEAARMDAPVAVPLRLIGSYWAAYYWPFVDAEAPIWQGPRNQRAEGVAADMAFRGGANTAEADVGGVSGG